MNLLIIGNGFDLAHGFPTMYSDFLNFFQIIMKTSRYNGDEREFLDKHLKPYCAPDNIKEYVKSAFKTRKKAGVFIDASNTNLFVQEIYDNLTDNIWYDYLSSIFEEGIMKGIGWIDFESEISLIIEQIDRFEKNLYMPFNITATNENLKLKKFLSGGKLDKFLRDKNKPDDYKSTYRDFLDKSYSDLRKFIRCMEIYLLECVECKPINLISQDIKELSINAVLCFNYTHTFEKVYSSTDEIRVHYIHGQTRANDNIDSNNMVLGIDEYYIGNERNKYTNYNIYKKFTQRILNDTGFLYRDWISKMDKITYEFQRCRALEDTGKTFPNNIYIFGHSLDITDEDVIKDLIDREGVKTTIFYYDKIQQTQQIANLVKMLSQEKFIDMINCVPQKICFVPQQPMQQYPVATTKGMVCWNSDRNY